MTTALINLDKLTIGEAVYLSAMLRIIYEGQGMGRAEKLLVTGLGGMDKYRWVAAKTPAGAAIGPQPLNQAMVDRLIELKAAGKTVPPAL